MSACPGRAFLAGAEGGPGGVPAGHVAGGDREAGAVNAIGLPTGKNGILVKFATAALALPEQIVRTAQSPCAGTLLP